MNVWKCFGPAATALSLFAAVHSASAADVWPTLRGPGRTAVSPDKNLLDKWPAEGPPLVWRTTGAGRGYSSLAIVDGKIYTFGDTLPDAPDKDEHLQCYDQKTGHRLWIHKTTPLWTEQDNPGWNSPRSTPTVDGDRVYVLSPSGVLVACKTSDGSELFRVDLVNDLHGHKQKSGRRTEPWGYSESVTVDGDWLVCNPGGTSATMAALDKKTGKVIWKAVREGDIGAGHASIVISNVGGTKVYVGTTGSGALGVRADDGKLMWSYPIPETTAVIPTPIVKGDLVFFGMGYGTGGAALLKQIPGTDHTVKVEPVYELKPELKNKHGGFVLIDDHIYADRDSSGRPYCAELMTGKITWSDKYRPSGKGSAAIAAADGHLYVQYDNGVVALVKADPSAYQEVGSFSPPGTGERSSWSHPVIVDGMLYLRENDSILCYDVRNKSGSSNAAGQ